MKTVKLFTLVISILFWSCKQNSYNYSAVNKIHPKDPFAATITESQFFEINADEDVVIEGKQGIIFTVPAGSLLSKGEKVVKGTVQVELTEALELSDMVFSNLTTSSNGELLSTGGMFFINFKQNEEQLVINKKRPIYVQVPRKSDKNMMLYQGERDSTGNMNWVNPQKPIKYLVPVDLSALNFTPSIFEQTLFEVLPISGVTVPTRRFTDSLYYTIEKTAQRMMTNPPPETFDIPIEPDGKKIVYEFSGRTDSVETILSCGINPLSVKALKNPKFQNTFIATKEFEVRIQFIHKTCRQDVLDLYVNNVDKNLSDVDKMAADLLKETSFEKTFNAFAKEDLGNVKDAVDNLYAKTLSAYYSKLTADFEKEEMEIQNKVKASLEKKNKEYLKALNRYQEILRKREEKRMKYFGYELTSTGWQNVDTGTVLKDWGEKTIVVKVDNYEKFEMLNTYIWMPNNQSLMRLSEIENKLFKSISARESSSIPLEKNQEFKIMVVGKIGDRHYFHQETKIPDTNNLIELSVLLKETSKKEIDEILNKQAHKSSKANEVKTDLKFQNYFFNFENEKQAYLNEKDKIDQLFRAVCFCCSEDNEVLTIGKNLFESYCLRCHFINKMDKIGPDLRDVVLRDDYTYFKRFTQNSKAFISSGNTKALAVYEKYNKAAMPSFPNLTDCDIKAIYDYLKSDVESDSIHIAYPIQPSK